MPFPSLSAALHDKLQAAISDPNHTIALGPMNVHELHRSFLQICALPVGEEKDPAMDLWVALIRKREIFDLVHRKVPQLNVTEAEVPIVEGGPLGVMLRALKEAGHLRTPIFETKLDIFAEDQYVCLEDEMYSLFPHELHPSVHKFLNGVYDINVPFLDFTSKENDVKMDRHRLVFLDRLFLKISTHWLTETEQKGSPGFWDFETAYQNFREDFLKNESSRVGSQ